METKNGIIPMTFGVIIIFICIQYSNYAGLEPRFVNLLSFIFAILTLSVILVKDQDKMNPYLYYGKRIIVMIPILLYLISMTGIFPLVMVCDYINCQSNMKNIGTALEMYSIDYKEQYPLKLKDLEPKYLKKIPQCVEKYNKSSLVAGFYHDAYGIGFEEYQYQVSTDRKAYTFWCKGRNHQGAGVGEDYPQYTSVSGLIAK